MRERQTDRDRETETKTERQRETETDRQTETDGQRQTDKQRQTVMGGVSEHFCTKVTMFRNAYSFHVSLLIRVLIRVQNCDNTKTQWQREKYTDYPNDSNSAYKGEKRSEEGEREGGGRVERKRE